MRLDRLGNIEPTDSLATTLRRMEELHRIALQQWECKKQRLINERRQQLLSIMEAYKALLRLVGHTHRFSQIVVYRGQPAIGEAGALFTPGGIASKEGGAQQLRGHVAAYAFFILRCL